MTWNSHASCGLSLESSWCSCYCVSSKTFADLIGIHYRFKSCALKKSFRIILKNDGYENLNEWPCLGSLAKWLAPDADTPSHATGEMVPTRCLAFGDPVKVLLAKWRQSGWLWYFRQVWSGLTRWQINHNTWEHVSLFWSFLLPAAKRHGHAELWVEKKIEIYGFWFIVQVYKKEITHQSTEKSCAH